jgi:cobalt/nickel transport system permease protein
VFAAAALADLATYLVTAAQLSLAFPAASGGFTASFVKFGSIYAITQVPLAITEGLLTVLVWNWLQTYGKPELAILQSIQQDN